MAVHLTVSEQLEPLAQRLALLLGDPVDDPFVADLVVVPGDGMRAWLTASLARTLGAVANVEFVYPGTLIRRALGDAPASPWSIASLTWAVAYLADIHRDRLGVDADLARARAIADRFDQYALHRPTMVMAWERGLDIDGAGHPVPPDQRWQPHLWRLLVEHLGEHGPASAQATRCAVLASGELVPDLAPRVALFGLTGLPPAHREALVALGRSRELHIFAPTPAQRWWHGVVDAARVGLLAAPSRAEDPSAGLIRHPVVATWARPVREGHLLLADMAQRSGPGHTVTALDALPADDPVTGGVTADPPVTVLEAVHRAVRADRCPEPGAKPVVDIGDRSFRWHRCHGAARQVEVLRDQILHLLAERDPTGAARYEPRDIIVLCPDVAAVAPLIAATFAGDPARGLPAVPVRVSDRSVHREVPLVETVGLLCGLLDGRARASELLGLLTCSPVRRRFGIESAADLETITAWIAELRIRWGFDAAARVPFGVPEAVTAHTWRAGLERLLLGLAMDDDESRFGPGDVVPFSGVEGDAVVLAGRLADLVAALHTGVSALAGCRDAVTWAAALQALVRATCALDDAESWQWQRFDQAVDAFVAAAVLGAGAQPVDAVARGDARAFAALFLAGLDDLPGRTRFGGGEVTVSSLTALRGVPSPVVCLIGLDGDLTSGSAPRADDLGAALVVIGDRDDRAELRAQLLDAVLAAQQRLVLVTTGRDVRSNAVVPPAVVVAELAELIDSSAVVAGPDGEIARPTQRYAIDHPRQAWSERTVVPDELISGGPWSFDIAALAGARSRRRALVDPLPFETSLFGLMLPAPEPLAEVTVDALAATLDNPVRRLLQHRLGIELPDDRGGDPLDIIPLQLDGLERWQLRDRLLQYELAAATTGARRTDWLAVQRAIGAVPPLAFGDAIALDVEEFVTSLVGTVGSSLAGSLPSATMPVDLEHRGVRIHGDLGLVHHGADGRSVLVSMTPSKLADRLPRMRLSIWLRLALASIAAPDRNWHGIVAGRKNDTAAAAAVSFAWRGAAPGEALDLVLDLAERARRCVVPTFPSTTWRLVHDTPSAARTAWSSSFGSSDATDRWVAFALGGLELDDLLAEPLHHDEAHLAAYGDSRIRAWAAYLWGAVTAQIREEAQ